MTSDPLYASYENIKRAKRKLSDLEALINGFVQSNPYTLRIERKAALLYVIARLDKQPPEDIPWDIVDLVGRLRAALDKATVSLVQRNGRGASGVGFPFGSIDNNTGQPNPFPDGRMEAGIKKKLTPEQWEFIEAQKPYPGGNSLLWGLNETANTDKHRNDLVETRLINSGAVAINRSGKSSFCPTDCDFILADKERERVFFVTEDISNPDIKLSVTPFIVFKNVRPIEGKEVLTTLSQQCSLVDSIINGMRAFF